jgi:hypothetical protein
VARDPGEDADGHRAGLLVAADPIHELPPVHDRHGEVDHHGARVVLGDRAQAALAVLGLDDGVALALEQEPERLP